MNEPGDWPKETWEEKAKIFDTSAHRRKSRAIRFPEDASNFSGKIFGEMLESSGLDPELVNEVNAQVREADQHEGGANVIFIFTDGDMAFTVLHVPDEAMDGHIGPVLTQGSTKNHIIAAYSRAYILAKLDALSDGGAGLHTAEAEEMWVEQLEAFAHEVKLEAEINPPVNWVDELGDI